MNAPDKTIKVKIINTGTMIGKTPYQIVEIKNAVSVFAHSRHYAVGDYLTEGAAEQIANCSCYEVTIMLKPRTV